MNSNPLFGYTDMMADKTATFTEFRHITIDIIREIRELTTKCCVGKEITDATFDINPRVDFRRSRSIA